MADATLKTNNPFALTLLYYHLYIRNKLCADLLSKVAKKYRKKSALLLEDLFKKYQFPVPDSVSVCEVSRLIGQYGPMPVEYSALIGSLFSASTYESSLDLYSSSFNAELAISRCSIYAPILDVPPRDNMTRVRHLLPGYDGPTPSAPAVSSSSSSTILAAVSGADIPEPVRKNCFDAIAEFNTRQYVSHDSNGCTVNIESPLAMLYKYMKGNIRVRIVIRRKGCVRGSLDAYVKAFDKHFNMILRDVDEEYITNQQPARVMIKGKFKNRNCIVQRHLPQLLLRGDNVVLVTKLP